MAPHERVLVDDAFLEDQSHGSTSCQACHGGDPQAKDFQAAHKGVKRDPSYPAPGVCADCHEAETKHYDKALHTTLRPMKLRLEERGDTNPAVQAKLKQAFDNHCSACHSSCGQCHVSRPASVKGGLLSGHAFEKKPPAKVTCTACHGSRVGDEFFGKPEGAKPDVHLDKAFLTCQKCHSAKEMHGDGQTYDLRREVSDGPKCLDCHQDIYTDKGRNKATHAAHRDKASCFVCHSQPYANCFGCHVKQDEKGQKYFELDDHRTDFKIGLNPRPTAARPEKFVTLRHVPVAPTSFDFYVPKGLTRFDRFPTWKPATPHNIQRQTAQNQDCNNCHGNRKLFLKASDVAPGYLKANQPVIVPEGKIPAQIKTGR